MLLVFLEWQLQVQQFIGTSNMDLNLSSSGTGSVTINQIKTNSVTGEVIPGKLGGTNFDNSVY